MGWSSGKHQPDYGLVNITRLWVVNLARLLTSDRIDWPPNVWMGVSVENQNYVNRIDFLKQTPAKIKFLSLEPLLGPLSHLNLNGIDWVIVGGESGPGSREIQEQWVIEIRDQCLLAGVPFFFKQRFS